ncbi:substrate-binding domain-containing protein [Desulforamulus aquiferis]|uniref:Substrate-binding domain-containing protein n=1 Tax=Desulforamulus aquiferis TaxID=1397668 RepID=A0AAW7ZCW6_9FIRM|nr:substrate-binding domain-containing protein [Desulforamulus aquiferis]MDO7787534.1 substrate-binding domain-containing protein [Desulforamulus aquiferis]RYD01620.1 tungsten ABC transporter substrate-binding protein [Desulforamulus aquiferis]
MKRFSTLIVLLLSFMLLMAGCQQAPKEEGNSEGAKEPAIKDVILATTTSTQDSGLLDVLKPEFEKQTGYNLKIIAVGTGAALKMGEKGEADVLLVHAPEDEKVLVDSGVGINYSLVMHNDFIIVGPENDPAGIKETNTTAEAIKKIYDSEAIFVSRGDDSGTHKKELGLWKEASLDPKGQKWYQESGTGMGQTLNIASEKLGYTLTDRATYLAQKNNVKLDILLEGDQSLLNIYHVMNVNPEKFDKVNAEGGKAFVDFMVAKETQDIIGNFGVDKFGSPLFFPDAGKDK